MAEEKGRVFDGRNAFVIGPALDEQHRKVRVCIRQSGGYNTPCGPAYILTPVGEFLAAVSDGQGHLYNNIEDQSEIVQINATTLKVEHVWPLGGGESPSGIAIDKKRRWDAVWGRREKVGEEETESRVVCFATESRSCAYNNSQVTAENGQGYWYKLPKMTR